jgi:L-ribulose-5-phosphate 3-epimerase
MNRRQFLRTSLSAAAIASIQAWAARAPIKLAHREGNMLRQSSPSVYELAASIPGLSGIEVQTVRSKLWDRATALTYKKESSRWKIRTISMGGTFPEGVSILAPGPAEEAIRKSIQSGELLGASVALIGAFHSDGCPNMNDEASYGPSIQLLKKMAPVAENAGIVLGMEMSLGLEDYQKFIDLVGHPACRPYWDATGTDHMGHPGDGIKGIEVLGNTICQMHLKNGSPLMEERHLLSKHPRSPVPERVMSIEWTKALPLAKKVGFEGWFAFETQHASPEACVEETNKNIAFVMRCWDS